LDFIDGKLEKIGAKVYKESCFLVIRVRKFYSCLTKNKLKFVKF